MKNSRCFIFPVALLLVLQSCTNYDRNADSPTSGKLKIGIDDSYTLMMDAQIYAFEQIYKHADIEATYKPESEVMEELMSDSIQEAVVCRTLTPEEEKYFESIQRKPETTQIAVDGVAIVVNNENPDTNFTMVRLKSIFSGEDSVWTNPVVEGQKMTIVFDHIGSCNARYIREVFLGEKTFPAYCFSANSNKEVIEYVNKNKNAIGVISVSWVSDQEDSTSRTFLGMVKVCGIRNDENPLQNDMYRKPYQAYIYDGSYALRRETYVIRTGLRGTLGTGFASFLAGEKGQLIIKKMGMSPVDQPVRTVRITNE
jgi:phosphate transport system substrate-binding protein